MRDDSTLMALADELSRYQLIKSVVKVTRMLHRPDPRLDFAGNAACFPGSKHEAGRYAVSAEHRRAIRLGVMQMLWR